MAGRLTQPVVVCHFILELCQVGQSPICYESSDYTFGLDITDECVARSGPSPAVREAPDAESVWKIGDRIALRQSRNPIP